MKWRFVATIIRGNRNIWARLARRVIHAQLHNQTINQTSHTLPLQEIATPVIFLLVVYLLNHLLSEPWDEKFNRANPLWSPPANEEKENHLRWNEFEENLSPEFGAAMDPLDLYYPVVNPAYTQPGQSNFWDNR